MKKLVFLGSKPIGAACLQFILDHSDTYNVEVIAVRTTMRKEFDQDNSVASIAQSIHIPMFDSLDDLPQCDIIYSVQHHEILKQKHIDRARMFALNLHLAPLPEYRGCNQFSFAIMNEEREFGVSIHLIDQKVDHGGLLFEKRFPIEADIWVEDLLDRSVDAGIQLFKETLQEILNDNFIINVVNTQNRNSRFYLREDIYKLKEISLAEDYSIIEKKIRATSMPGFEPPFTIINGDKIFLVKEKNYKS